MKELLLAGLLTLPGGVCHQRQVQVVQQQAAAVVVQQTPVIVQQQAFAGHYYRVGADQRLEAIADAVADRVLQRIQQGGTQIQGAAPPTSAAQQLVNKNCVSCHRSDSENGDLTDIAALNDEMRLSMLRQVYNQKMPKNAPPLSNEEVSVLVDWIAKQ